MNVDADIGAHGFRRWYERQLAEGFAYLTTGVLSLIMTAIAIEMLEFRSSAAGLLALVASHGRRRAVRVHVAALPPAALAGRIPRRARDLRELPSVRQVHAALVASRAGCTGRLLP